MRYKKRFFMTIFGIGGCMALMIVGYGIQDSVYQITAVQYSEIQTYDGQIILQDDLIEEDRQKLDDFLTQDADIAQFTDAYMKNLTLKKGKASRQTYIVVLSNPDRISDYVDFHDRKTGEKYELDDSGVALSEKTAKLLGVRVGDTVTIQNEEEGNREVQILLALFATVMVLFGVLSLYMNMDMQLAITVVAFLAAVSATFILVKYQDAAYAIKQADVNHNHAIILENRAKIKYVNSKNAVDFTCEKYHVRNAYELQFLYEQYQEEARKRESFRKNSDDLEYYSKSLVQYLTRLRMYDARVWINHANAIVDSRELVELKHNLITRRQKLRSRIEYSLNNLSDMKRETLKKMDCVDANSRHKVEQIIRKLEAMNPVL
jgi:hypothetical protein